MKRSIILFLISCSLLTTVSCKKKKIILPEPTLPAVTQEGLNTFGFMFGKEVWIPNLLSSTLSANYAMHSDGLKLNFLCRRKSPQNLKTADTFNLKYANANISAGTYELNETNCKIDVETILADNTPKEYSLFEKGSITFIRWDLKNRVGSGTFSFNVKEKTTGEIVSISQGRFDMILAN
jgi:hypothetical protein